MNTLAWLKQQRQAVVSAKNLAGLTACSRLLEVSPPCANGGTQLILRQQNARATHFGIQYAQEACLLQHLSSLSFVPKVYYAAADSSLLHWIKGDVPSHFSDTLLTILASQLARLHSMPLTPDLPRLDLAQRCQYLWQNLSPEQQTKLNFKPPFHAIAPFAQAICHHDLHLNNLIVCENKLFIIDWEYTAVSDPALEIALFLTGNSLTPNQQDVFLERYLSAMKFEATAFKRKMAEYHSAILKLNQLWFALSELF